MDDERVSKLAGVAVRRTIERDGPKYGSVTIEFTISGLDSTVVRIGREQAWELYDELWTHLRATSDQED